MGKQVLGQHLLEYLPMPKFLGRFSNSGLVTFLGSTFLPRKGAEATFFFPFLGFG